MITVIQPDGMVPVDYFQEWLEESGHEIRLIKAETDPVPDISDVGDGIVILGGRMSIFDVDTHPHLTNIRRLIRGAVDRNIPLLGICLGHQLLADALGGTVVVGSDQDEHGPIKVKLNSDGKKDTLLSSIARKLGDTFHAAASHNDCVIVAPEGATILASSTKCDIQAFRIGSALGVQFHPEVRIDTMSRWHALDGGNYSEMMAMLHPYRDDISVGGKEIALAFGNTVGKVPH